jgi:hypothetical protein
MAMRQAAASLNLTKLGVAAPFVLAIILYLIAPFLTARVKTVLRRQVQEDARRHGVTAHTSVPGYLRPEMIDDYVEFVADAVQIIPATLLPVLGAVLAIAAKVAAPISILILVFAIIVAVVIDALVLSRAAADYVSRKWHGYSIVASFGIVINICCIALIVAYG